MNSTPILLTFIMNVLIEFTDLIGRVNDANEIPPLVQRTQGPYVIILSK